MKKILLVFLILSGVLGVNPLSALQPFDQGKLKAVYQGCQSFWSRAQLAVQARDYPGAQRAFSGIHRSLGTLVLMTPPQGREASWRMGNRDLSLAAVQGRKAAEAQNLAGLEACLKSLRNLLDEEQKEFG